MTSLGESIELEARKRAIEKHRNLSIHYLENAIKAIQASNAEKASEFLWGSVAQALKAVAANKDIQLRTHNDIRKYALELTKAMKNETIWHTFERAQSLHSNFYESGLMLEDVIISADEVKATVVKLLSLVSEEGAA